MGLSAEAISKYRDDRPVVSQVDIEVQRGEIVGLIGPSGAGKTTIFDMLIGVLTPDEGHIFLDGADITAAPMFRRARLGLSYLPQRPSVLGGLTVEENILLVLENQKARLGRRRWQLDRLLHDFGLADVRRSSVLKISGGERRKCELASAMASNPGILLLDEPFSGVDPLAIEDISASLKSLSRRGLGLLISDHKAREALRLVDRAYLVDSGRIAAHGTAADLAEDPVVRRSYLGQDFLL